MQKVFDAHLHLWNLQEFPISWVNSYKELNQNFDFNKARKEYKDFKLLGAMYVETNSDNKDKENLFALKLKKLYGLKLCLADLKYKEEICAFREVMHISQKGAKRLFESDFKEIVKILEKAQIVLEICLKNRELGFLEKFLEENLNLKVVLDHMGNPEISCFCDYKKDLKRLKKFPNLYIKLSSPDSFSIQTSQEFIFELFLFLKENFSEDKFLFGSNYPVSKLNPNEWVNLILKSETFKYLDAIFYKNALELYKGG
ncbi:MULTISPECIES: amidohydrolase family protein [Campylobacter]|uniref:Amidohydrolase family protein n=1 Tax=Campylobacter molothri TaxID=1032242 RepID=A0ACC5W1A3_9BACT|nr:amidohydrolase family protein [Campylobacter sp. RM9760]MBZ7974400.1 amidohydrolase family protein [Campylobacter sp. RM9754]